MQRKWQSFLFAKKNAQGHDTPGEQQRSGGRTKDVLEWETGMAELKSESLAGLLLVAEQWSELVDY